MLMKSLIYVVYLAPHHSQKNETLTPNHTNPTNQHLSDSSTPGSLTI